MKPIFESQEESIKWVGMNIALAIPVKSKTKKNFVFPFRSWNAHNIVVENLGKQLFKHQEETLKKQ